MKLSKLRAQFLILGVCSVLSIALSGCRANLSPTGVYKSDNLLYNADQAAKTAYEGIHAFVNWEYQNHAEIKSTWPEVTKAADTVRVQAPLWWKGYNEARAEYVNAKQIFGADGTAPEQIEPVQDARRKLLDALGSMRNGMTNAQTIASSTKLSNVPQIQRGKDLEDAAK